MVFVYITCQDLVEAKRLGEAIVSSRAAACVNMWPIESAYLEDGVLKSRTEATLLIKTMEPKVQEIENLILKAHTYSTPFIGVFEVKRVNREYKDWMVGAMG